MYPHIYVHNVATGSSSIRCDCAKMCSSKEVQIQCNTGFSGKSFSYQAEDVLPTEKLLYKNDSIAIGMWSLQVRKYPIFMPESLDDLPITSAPPPATPRRKSLTISSCSNDHQLRNGEVRKPKSRLDSLVDAVSCCENQIPNDSIDCTTPMYAGFENLIMLAEEAVKRIPSLTPRSKET